MSLDATNLGAVIDAYYSVLCGPAGPRDWSLHEQIFMPDAQLIRTGVDEDGRAWSKRMTPADYRENVALFFSKAPFYEFELERRIDRFGDIAQIWSSYEMRRAPESTDIERRGVNFIQALRGADGTWKVVAAIWANEREDLKLPD